MQTFDVAVIGLGAMGSATAYQLSKMGLKVVGIDKHNPPHSRGSSHGESRITRQALGEGSYYSPLALRSNEIWQELQAITGQELYNPNGLLMISNRGNNFFEGSIKAAQKYDIAHEVLGSKEITNRFPAVSMSEDEVAYYEYSGGFLRPEKCIEVQLKLAEANGVELLRNTEVLSIDEVGDGITIHLEDGTSVKAAKVILSQGPWISDFLPQHLKPLFKTLYQTLYWFDFDESHVDELSADRLPTIICDTNRLEGPDYYNFYGFPVLGDAANGIKFAIHEVPPAIDPDKKDEIKPIEGAADLLYKNVSKYVSYIKPKIMHSMNCVYTVTPDEDFIIDFAPGSERLIIASPCSGHGFKHSAAIGEVLAQMAATGVTDIDISKFSFARF